MTEDDIRSKSKVTLKDAAEFLSMPIDKLRARAKRGCYDFIEANLNEGSSKWSFWVHKERLIKFKRGE